MNRFLLILLIIGLISCHNLKHQPSEIKSPVLLSLEKEISSENVEKKDWKYEWGFERENGSFLRYFCEGENMFIEYGNEQFKKIMKDTFLCTDSYVGIPRQWWDNEDFICLQFGCGSPCWGSNILPLNEKDTVETYLYQYGYDEKRNLIIYLDYEAKKDKPFVVAKNLKSKGIEKTEFDACDDVAFMGYCIDSISYKNGELYLQTRNVEELKKGLNSKGSNVIRKKIRI